MIYRVVLKISYYENWYDFTSLAEAGAFAEAVLTHAVQNEDMEKTPTYVTMKVMKILDPSEVEEEAKGEEE